MYNPIETYYHLPLLASKVAIETKKVLEHAIAATRIWAELKGRADEIPNQSMVVNAIRFQEAKEVFRYRKAIILY